jgi:hypothetical protein
MREMRTDGQSDHVVAGDRHGRLVRELDALRQRGVERVDSHEHGRLGLPELDALLEASPWQAGCPARAPALRTLIERALTYCPDPEPLAILFADVSPERYTDPDSLYDEAWQLHPDAQLDVKKTRQRWVAKLRAQLAAALLALEESGFAPGPGSMPSLRLRTEPAPAPLPGLPGPFVERTNVMAWLRQSYNALADAGGGRLCLTGTAGSGKTVLATWLMSVCDDPAQVGYIRLHQRGVYEEDLRRTLQLLGRGTEILPEAHATSVLRQCIAANTAPKLRLLVLDDVRVQDDIQQLVPPACPVPVLITGRELVPDMTPSDQPSFTMALTGMSEEASRELLGVSLEPLTDTDAAVLIDQLRGHPASLVLARTALIHLGDLDVSELLGGLQTSTGQTLDDLETLFGDAGALRRLVTGQVRELDGHPATQDLLACLAWGSGTGTMTLAMLRRLHAELARQPIGSITFHAGLTRLEHSGLIHQAKAWVSMTPLIHQLVRETLPSTAERVMLAIEVLARLPREDARTDAQLDVLRQEYALMEALPCFAQAEAAGDDTRSRLLFIGEGTKGQSTWAWFWSVDEERHAMALSLGYPESSMLWPGTTAWLPLDPELAQLIGKILPEYHETVQAEAARGEQS